MSTATGDDSVANGLPVKPLDLGTQAQGDYQQQQNAEEGSNAEPANSSTITETTSTTELGIKHSSTEENCDDETQEDHDHTEVGEGDNEGDTVDIQIQGGHAGSSLAEEDVAKEIEERMKQWAPWKDFDFLGNTNASIQYNGEEFILGMDPCSLHRAIVGWNASNCQLDMIRTRLQRLRALQIFVIRGTELMSLKDLECCSLITSIQATENKLINVLDFKPMERDPCQYEEQQAGGIIPVKESCVRYANLSNNMIAELHDISQHVNLQQLILSNNQISQIHDLSALKFLRHLDLSFNCLNSIEDLVSATELTSLNIRGNEICSVQPLKNLWKLEKLDVSNNLLPHLEGLQDCHVLYEVVCAGNKIETVYDIEPLIQLSLLTHFDARKNPFQEEELSRLRTLYRLPLLATLDGEVVKDEERVRAKNLHGYDKQIRQNNFHKYLPTEMFTDISKQIDPHEEQRIGDEKRKERLSSCRK